MRDIFTPLRLGAMLCFPDTMESSASLGAWFEREKISVAHLTPQTTQLLTDGSEKKLPALRRAFFGGDILTRSVLARFQALAPSAECVNFYGATETPQAMGFHPVPKIHPARNASRSGAASRRCNCCS